MLDPRSTCCESRGLEERTKCFPSDEDQQNDYMAELTKQRKKVVRRKTCLTLGAVLGAIKGSYAYFTRPVFIVEGIQNPKEGQLSCSKKGTIQVEPSL